MVQKQEMFSKDVMSYVDRTFLTQHTTPISLIKQSMHILIMFHSNHCWFILRTLPAVIQKTLNYMHCP